MSQRVRHFVYCTTVTRCDDAVDCDKVDIGMEHLGFQPRSSEVRDGCCVRGFVQERADGQVEQLRDTIAEQLPVAACSHIGEWRAFVQVCGKDAAWATLSAGRPVARGSIRKAVRQRMNSAAHIPDYIGADPLLCSFASHEGSADASQEDPGMSKKNGPIIHVERGYQIAEVIDDRADAKRFVGYRLIGPGADELPVFATEAQALHALAQLAVRRPDPATE
jgi:hypothetical protein